MDVDAYLERIGYAGSREPTAETLRRLHRAHMFAVPFENLDIALGQPIGLSPESLFDKIVRHRRGGFCYELNGLFAWLLEQLGFAVTLLSARVFDGDRPGPEFDHLTLIVRFGTRVIADVGFGDSFLEPLPLDDRHAVVQDGSEYRITGSDPELVLERREGSTPWQRQYLFSLMPRRLSEFSAMCEYHQTSPASHFTKKSVCSLATPAGRVTVSGRRAIVTTTSGREEREIADEEEYRMLLKSWFGIDLASMKVQALMSVLLLLTFASSGYAQAGDSLGDRYRLAHARETGGAGKIRQSVAAIDYGAHLISIQTPAKARQAPSSGRRRSTGRKVLGGVIGGVGGFFGGGVLGAAIEGDRCDCDDPGFVGFLIGAPTGAAIGAILGVKFF